MDVKISYLFIFGIITVITGKPATYNAEDSRYVRNEVELENLLQSLADQGKLEVVSNYREDAPNAYHKNRAGSSRYDVKPSPYYKVDSPQYQYYKSGENTDYEQPSVNDLQIINQFLKRNDVTPGSNNAQNLLEDLLSLERNNKFKLLKPSDEATNVDEVVALLGDIQRVSDEENYRDYNVYDKAMSDNLRGNLFPEQNYKPKEAKPVQAVLSQGKHGVIKLVGNKPQYHEMEYLKLNDNDLNRNVINDRDGLRCNGKSCTRTNIVNDGKNDRLSCRGRFCTRTRNDDNHSKLNYDSKLSAQKIKVNDELDAVVLGLSDVEHLLSKLAVPKPQRTNKQRDAKLLQNVNFENLLNSRSSNNKKDNVEAIVFDLTKVENGDAVARQIKQLLSQNDRGYDEYEEYGNLVENHLKQGIYDLQEQASTGRANAKSLPAKKGNSKMYLPQWILDEVISRSYGKDPTVNEVSRSMFPLTRQQKERMNKNRKNQKAPRVYRRNFDQDVGVPFHMEVQGLGQVNP